METNYLNYLFVVELYLNQNNTSNFHRQKPEDEDQNRQEKKQTELKTVILWTRIYNHASDELTSWRHCPNDIKGSCVFTTNQSQYEVLVRIVTYCLLKENT